VRWLDPDWQAEAIAWIEEAIDSPPTGAVEQPHVYPWTTVLRVPTREGDLWFKASASVHRFEPALALELVRVMPDRVPEVVAADPGRGWLLMRDAGTRLRDLVGGRDQLPHWERLLPLYAELQIALAPRASELVTLGVPDERLENLTAHFERLLGDEDALLVGQPDGLSVDELARLRAAVLEVAALCRELAAYGVPETLQHDDFHDGQVFVADGRYRFLDWGDSCVSHPFHTLVVTLRAAAHKHGFEPGGPEVERLRDVYLEPFGGSELAAAVDLAHRTGTIARALAWHRFVSAPDAAVRSDDGVAVPYGLQLFLANGPLGSWDPAAGRQ
jgi:hypothetical protein